MTREKIALLETAKTLIIAYGPTEAAKQLNVNRNTVLGWALRYKWKKARGTGDPTEQNTIAGLPEAKNALPEGNPEEKIAASDREKKQSAVNFSSPANALRSAISAHRDRSTLALGKFTAEAAEEAASLPKGSKLAHAPKVRDLAGVHSVLWPAEKSEGILEVGLLIGQLSPRKLED